MLSNNFSELLKKLEGYFDDKYSLVVENIEYLEKLVFERNEKEVKYCGTRVRLILEIILSSFAKKTNPNLFSDPLIDEKERNNSAYRINKINNTYEIDKKIITSLHNIRIFSNSLVHLNDEKQGLESLSSALRNIKIVLEWLSSIPIQNVNQTQTQNVNPNQNVKQTNNFPNQQPFVPVYPQQNVFNKSNLKKPDGLGKLGGILNIIWAVLAIIFIIYSSSYIESINKIYENESVYVIFFLLLFCFEIWNIVANAHFLKGKNNLISVRLSTLFSLSIFGLIPLFYYISKKENENTVSR